MRRVVRLLRALILPPLVIAIVIGIVLIGRSGWQATAAVGDLQTAAAAAAQLREALAAGDVAAAEQQVAAVRDASREASERLEGPSWRLTERLPGIGDDIMAVRRSSRLVLQAAEGAGDPLIEVARLVGPEDLRPVDGRIDPARLAQVRQMLAGSTDDLERLSESAARIDLDKVVPDIRAAVSGLQFTLARTSQLVSEVEVAADVLPGVLGADGPRRYLVLLLDSSIASPGGGEPVAYAVLDAADGALTVTEDGSLDALGPVPGLEIAGRDALLAGADRIDGFDGAFSTPDFARTGAYVRRLWQDARPDLPVDGVAALDGVALADVVAVVGGEAPGAPEDAADALGDTLRRALAGDGDSGVLLDVLGDEAVGGRLHVWSADEAVQRRIADAALAGVPTGLRDDRPFVGVYLSPAAEGDPMLRLASTRLRPVGCGPEGQQAVLSAVISVAEPVDAVVDAADGPVEATVLLLGSTDGTLSRDVTVDGGQLTALRPSTVDGRPALRVDLRIPRGEAAVVRTPTTTGPGQTTEPRLVVPAADPPTRVRVDPSRCAPDVVPGP